MDERMKKQSFRGNNYGRIEQYFLLNPFAKQMDCAEDLNLSQNCVSVHWRAMHAKWKTQRAHEKARLKLIRYDLDVGGALQNLAAE